MEKLTTKDELIGATSWPGPSKSLASGQPLQGQELHHPLHLPGSTWRKGGDGSERKEKLTGGRYQQLPPNLVASPCDRAQSGTQLDPRVAQRCWPQLLLLDGFSHQQLLLEHVPSVTHHVPKVGAEHEAQRDAAAHTALGHHLWATIYQPWLTDQQPEKKKKAKKSCF